MRPTVRQDSRDPDAPEASEIVQGGSDHRSARVLFVLPLAVLLVARLGVEASDALLPMRWSWVPAFVVYYASIEVCVRIARHRLGIPPPPVGALRPLPPARLVAFGVVLPALPAFAFFVLNVDLVPAWMLVAVLGYALINPYFEETFWRGLLEELPAPPAVRTLYSAFLFGFSHYFLWGAVWLADPPRKWMVSAVATFFMGILWSWLYRRDGRLAYPMASHFLVDIGNLSVAVFTGVALRTV